MDKTRLKLFFQISIIKTLRFNLSYFGLKGLLKLPVLISHNLSLRRLKGKVEIDSFKRGHVNLGFGDLSVISKKEKGSWTVEKDGKVVFRGHCHMGPGTRIDCEPNSALVIGNNVSFTGRDTIICYPGASITIGDSGMCSWDCLIMNSDTHKVFQHGKQSSVGESVVIGDHVWICCRVTILKGANIPNNTIVAACSTITKTLPESNAVYGGVNKLLETDVSWEL